MRLISTADIQQALQVSSRKEAIRKAKELGAVYHEGTGGFQWELESLPQDMQLGLLTNRAAETRLPQPESILMAPERNRKTGLAVAALVATWTDYEEAGMRIEEFVSLYNDGQVASGCRQLIGKSISTPTLYRWTKAFRQGGVDAVTPKWGTARSGSGSKALTPFEQDVARAFYLTTNKWTAGKVRREMHRCYGTQASEQTVARYLASLPPYIVSFYRDGETKFKAKFLPYIKGNHRLYEPMEMVVSDHHNWDFLVERDGQIFRPWITIFQDHRSRKVLSWSHSLYPSTQSIAEALYMMLVRYGSPRVLHIDNGKDYRGHYLRGKTVEVTIENNGMSESAMVEIQGVLAGLGIRVIYALPYHGQSKPVERAFGTYAGDFAKEFESYVGSNTVARPEETQLYYRRLNGKEKKEVVVSYEAYKAAWEAYIEQWNATHHHRGDGMEGRTPNEEFFANWRTKRTVSPEYLEIAFAKTDARVVQKDGIRIDNMEYWADELRGYIGTSVLVKRTFAEQNRAMIFDLDGRFITYAEANYFYETGDLAKDNERVNSERKKIMQDIREFNESLPILPEGRRGAVDFAQAHRGMYSEPDTPDNLKVEQVVNGAFEIPDSRPALTVVEKKAKRTLRSSLDDSLE
jgi:putative transposase